MNRLAEIITDILIRERANRGISQKEFADLLGVSRQTINKWEQGIGIEQLSLSQLQNISNRLDLEIKIKISPTT